MHQIKQLKYIYFVCFLTTTKKKHTPHTSQQKIDNNKRSSIPNIAANNNRNYARNSNTSIDLSEFCAMSVPDFTPQVCSRPDAAVAACVAVWEEEEKEALTDVIPPPPPEVLDIALAMICAPLIIKHLGGPPGPGGTLYVSLRHRPTTHTEEDHYQHAVSATVVLVDSCTEFTALAHSGTPSPEGSRGGVKD